MSTAECAYMPRLRDGLCVLLRGIEWEWVLTFVLADHGLEQWKSKVARDV